MFTLHEVCIAESLQIADGMMLLVQIFTIHYVNATSRDVGPTPLSRPELQPSQKYVKICQRTCRTLEQHSFEGVEKKPTMLIFQNIN